MFEVLHGQAGNSIYPILSEIFLLNAVLYWEDFRRATAGVLAAVLGLTAWGAVFPCALLLERLVPQLTVIGELWNVPKYFVAFGMILTLLEEQKRQADRTSEEYRVLFENNPHPMWIFEMETLRFLAVNDAAVTRYGYSAEEFRKMTLRDIRPAEEVPAMEDALAQQAGSETVMVTGPWTHILRDGRRIQVEVSSHSIRFRRGAGAVFAGAGCDGTAATAHAAAAPGASRHADGSAEPGAADRPDGAGAGVGGAARAEGGGHLHRSGPVQADQRHVRAQRSGICA